MVRDKYIYIRVPEYTVGDTGGSTATYTEFWKGWAKVNENPYITGLESGQYVGNKPATFNINKNEISKNINSTMLLFYRGDEFLISSIVELDSFSLLITARKKDLK